MDSLKLKVHSSGYDSTFQGLNMETAWMHVDLPSGNNPGADSSTVIYGNPKSTHSEADESACQAVLNYYCSARDGSINDFSHSVIKMKQEQLDASNFFYAAMQDNVVSLALERDATLAVFQKSGDSTDAKPHPLSKAFIKKKQDELNNDCFYEILQDKITNLLRDRDVQKQRYTSIIHGMASICDTFADILPIKKISTNQTTSEDAETGFVFTGSKKTLRAVMNFPWLS